MKKLFLIIGAPGSGKTTDASLIAQKHKTITHYSTGDMLRAEVQGGSSRGQLINSYVSKGNLVPIDIVIKTLLEAIKKSPTNVVIIDGYPRSEEQMKELDKHLENEKNIKLVNVIEVVVSQEVAKNRVLQRSRGDDDNAEVFYNRMKVYSEPIAQIQIFYETKKLLKKINGGRSIEEVVYEMDEYIQSKI